jgi:hypothetical protein
MSEEAFDAVEATVPAPEPDGELVHWMAPRRLRVGPTGLSAAAGAAFTVGVLTTIAVLAFTHWLGPDRALELPKRRRD